MIALAWVIFAAFLLGLILFCYMIVKYYQDRAEAELLPTVATILGLTVTLLCVFLIPVDIYNISSTQDGDGQVMLSPSEIESRSNSVKIIYYILYACILALAFGIIPFAYFYYEEADEDNGLRERIWAGCKYTIFLIIIVVVILIVGLILYFVNPSEKPTSTTAAKEWAANLLSEDNVAEAAISFAIACLTLIGYVIWLTYTAYGLSAFPIGIIKGRKHIAEEINAIQTNIEITRDKAKSIKSRYLGTNKTMSKKDSEQLELLKRQEKVLARQGSRLDSDSACGKVMACFKPFFFIFGIVFILVSLLIILSILLTSIDKGVNSTNFCGSSCGFVLAYPEIFNPIDTLLTILESYFPLDYAMIALIVFYIFFTTLNGISQIGIRLLWMSLFKLKKGKTPPQALLMTAIILMLAILALNMEVTTLAPQYASWGSQKFLNTTSGKLQPCSLDAPMGNCTMSQIGTFVNRIMVRTTFFGWIFYIATWLFLIAFFIGLIVAIFKAKPSNVEEHESDSDEDEEKN